MHNKNYINNLKSDKKITKLYYIKTLTNKSEQQKSIEKLLNLQRINPHRIADIACGGGGASLHLSKVYTKSIYYLLDINPLALSLAKKKLIGANFIITKGSIYKIPFPKNYFDLVICCQTLSWISNPLKALNELVRICRPKGTVIATSLFNTDHDVDIYAKLKDNTRNTGKLNQWYSYNTIS